jgi:hypothetical protein
MFDRRACVVKKDVRGIVATEAVEMREDFGVKSVVGL